MSVGTLNPARRSLTWPAFLGGDLGPGAQDHGGAHLLAEDGMGHADHGGVGHGGMFEQRRLDLDRVHVFTAADDHVLGPVHDVDETVLVDAGDVSGVQPPPGEGRPGGVGPVSVAAHDVGPFDPQLAGDVGADGQVARWARRRRSRRGRRHVAHRDGGPTLSGLRT